MLFLIIFFAKKPIDYYLQSTKFILIIKPKQLIIKKLQYIFNKIKQDFRWVEIQKSARLFISGAEVLSVMSNPTSLRVTFDGSGIVCQLERKPVKNLNLRIRKDGSGIVSANDLVSVNKADEFVISKVAYIISLQCRSPSCSAIYLKHLFLARDSPITARSVNVRCVPLVSFSG
ncbi:MAG: hypothetical protein GX628_01080 [Clostridiales bacterium]|nr:hypothetical protein [Clostridiales bacterium]